MSFYGDDNTSNSNSSKSQTETRVWVVYALLPKKLTAICSQKTGKTQDECYGILLELSKTGGIPAVEKQLTEWEVEWEVRPLYGDQNPKPTSKQPTPKANIEVVEPEDDGELGKDAIAAMIAKISDPYKLEIYKTQKYLHEQEKLLEEAKVDLFAARAALKAKEEWISKKAWQDEDWRMVSETMSNEEWDIKRAEAVEFEIRRDYPEYYTLLESALMNVQQIEAEIEAAQITIDNLSETEE